MINIIGISAFYHDSAACLVTDGEIINAAQEERFTRIKNDPSFPFNALKFCLENNNFTLDQIDLIVFYEKPFIKFERIIETHLNVAPHGFKSFLIQIPLWFKNRIFIKNYIYEQLKKLDYKKVPEITFIPHHFSHLASAFYPSPFEESAIITIDAVGEWTTASIGYGRGNKIKILKELYFPDSLGLFYSSLTYYLGFKVNSDEYKVMGLAPYGNEASNDFKNIYERLKRFIKINEDGSVQLNQRYFNYLYEDRMVNEKKWKELLGFKKREPDEELCQYHCDLALAGQRLLEEAVLKTVQFTKKLLNSKNLSLAGGVFLNCVANSKILESGLFDNIWVQPAAGDAGGAIGSALAGYYVYFNKERLVDKKRFDAMKWSYLGPSYDRAEILKVVKKHGLSFKIYDNFDQLIDQVTDFILEDMVVGWFQGNLEWGPRALGNRSILANPYKKEMQKVVNLKIKFREGFRPFAPAILEEDLERIFDFNISSPYMLFVAYVKDEFRFDNKQLNNLSVREKINFSASKFPAVTHVDYSARLQTVREEANPRFYKLLKRFKEKTGFGIILNTSFNVKNEPIVYSPQDAVNCFLRTEMDLLVMENILIKK